MKNFNPVQAKMQIAKMLQELKFESSHQTRNYDYLITY